MVEKWKIKILALTGDEERGVYVYLPEAYAFEPERRYEVLYMFDGHNVFFEDFYCLAFQYDFAFGILMAALGLLILIRGETYSRMLYVVLGLVILTDALFRIQMSLDAKKFGLSLWWRILLVAVLTGILGMILVVDPYNGEGGAARTLVGAAVVLEGILNLCVAVYTIKILDRFCEPPEERGRS